MNAVGIHEHPQLKLGLRPPTPAKPRLRLADFLRAIPPHPTTLDYLPGITYGLYTNDKYGICGPTYLANNRRLITAKLTGTMKAPTQADVDDLYRRSGNPRFDPTIPADDPRQDDNGVNMQQMLEAAMSGGLGGVKPLGFASVDVSNLDELAAAISYVGGLGYGVMLQQAQQAQTSRGFWDYSRSAQWGGHAILAGGYGPKGDALITWAKEIVATNAFLTHQLSEAWVVIWPEHLTDHGFMTGVDMQAFAAAYTAMTGKPFPAVIPPPPPPPPVKPKYTVTLSSDSPIRVG